MSKLLNEIQTLSAFDFSSHDVDIIADQLYDCAIEAYGKVAGAFIASQIDPERVDEWVRAHLGSERDQKDDYILGQNFDQFYGLYLEGAA